MKKLNKLQINSEKLIKNEELMNLRGGYGEPDCTKTSKTEACAGLAHLAKCCWTYNTVVQYGKCISIYTQPLHCSDLA